MILIRDAAVIPVEPAGVVHDPGWVLIDPPVIAAVGEGSPPPIGTDDRLIDGRGTLVLPGLVSCHQHLLDVLLRGGLPSGPTFLDWLLGLYYRGISAYRPEDAGLATMLAIAETARAGVTCVVDNWGVDNGADRGRTRECTEASLGAWRSSGLRVVFARMLATRLPDSWGTSDDALVTDADEALADIEALIAAHDDGEGGRVRICPAPELPELVDPWVLAAALEMAEANGTVMPMHLLASPESRASADAAALDRMNLLTPALLGAHCTAARSEDVDVLAGAGVKVAHCPTSNSFRGGVAPAAAMLRSGLTVGLGSDNATLNCNSDIIAEMRRAVLTSRIAGAPDGDLTPFTAVRMATIDGARAAGLDHLVGSLLPGKRADVVVLDASGPHWWPRHDWFATLVFQGRASDVRTVLVDGRVVLDGDELSFLDPEAERRLCVEAQAASQRIAAEAGLATPRRSP